LDPDSNPDPDLESDPELITDPDPDPNLQIIPDPVRSGCTTLLITTYSSTYSVADLFLIPVTDLEPGLMLIEIVPCFVFLFSEAYF
jgi:hypothetical protein